MKKQTTLAALVLAALVPALAHADCATPDPSPTVVLGTLDTGLANRAVNGACTIDDLIGDEQAWGSQPAFLAHVSKVAFDLLKTRKITAAERSRLMAAAQQSGIGTTLKVKLIGFNDFHGNIKSGEGSASNPGVARFATLIKQLKAANAQHAVVSAGDMIGASPLTSALFKDEPTIEAMNRIGIDFNAVGNHEFDEGRAELLRMQNGGNHPTDPFSGLGLAADLRNGAFKGADFKFLAANVIDIASNTTLLPGVGVKDFLGNKVAFIGMTLESTPTIVSPSGVAGLQFNDEADTVNALVPQIRAQGIKTIVVLIHEGGLPTLTGGVCTGISGAIVDIVNRLDPEVDLVISGHTHQAYSCLINNAAGKPVRVTSAGQFARVLSDIDMTIDTRTKDVVSIVHTNLNVGSSTSAVVQDPSLLELVNHYSDLSTVPASRVVGNITATITRTNNLAGESALGDVIADAQLAATSSAGTGDAVVAFMNPGGIRADLPFSAPPKVDGTVTYGEAFTVQPFGNSLVTMTVTGADLDLLLEQQFMGCNQGYPAGSALTGQPFNRILQVSNGFSYSYSAAGPACAKVDAASIRINGVVVDPVLSYRITVNSFLADGGDQFFVLRNGTNRLGGAVDTDALEAYLLANPAGVAPGPQNRITRLP